MAKKVKLAHSEAANSEVRRFRRAAKQYAEEATVSKETAIAALKRIGIYNSAGKLVKPYR